MEGQTEKPVLLRLNEVAKLNKLELQWTTLSEEGPPHSRTFTMQLIIGSETYQGTGQSKKKAQIVAAEACLLNTALAMPPAKMKLEVISMDDTAPSESSKRPLEAESECSSNGAKKPKVEEVEMVTENAVSAKPPLMAVYEMARFNNIEISFTIANETGPPHAKTFEAVLKLGEETYRGSGSSHKKAQTMCAEAALQQTQHKRPVTTKAKPKRQKKKADAAVEGEETTIAVPEKIEEEEFVVVKGVKLPTQVFKVPDGQGGPYFCSICSVHLNSFQQLKQHLESTKHDRKQNPQSYQSKPEPRAFQFQARKPWRATAMSAKKPIGKSFVRGGYLDRARPEGPSHRGGGAMQAPFYSGNQHSSYQHQQWNAAPAPVSNPYGGSRTTGYGYTADQYENTNNYSGGYNQDVNFSSYPGGYSAPQGGSGWNMAPTGVPPPPGPLVQNDYHNSEHSNAWN